MEKIQAPTYSPWNAIQHRYRLAEGVYWVSTASHGGLMVHGDVAADALTPQARAASDRCNYSGQEWYAFEEDCTYAIAFFEQPEWLRESRRQDLRDWKKIIDDPGSTAYQDLRDEAPARVAALTAQLALSNAGLLESVGVLKTISTWDAEYLIARKIEPDPEGYAHWKRMRAQDAARREKDPDFIVSALGHGGTSFDPVPDGVVKVWTADQKTHFVTAESYPPADGSYLLSRCVLADVEVI